MKLLFITNGYPPAHAAGTEVYTAGLASALAQAGHTVRVLCAGAWQAGPQPLNDVSEAEQDGVTVTRLNLNWRQGPDPNRYLFDNPLVEQYLLAQLERDPPDLVHVTSCYTLSASVLRAVKRHGLKLVVTLTDFWFLCPRVTLLRGDGTLCDGQTSSWTCLRCLLGQSKAYRWPSAVLPPAIVQPALMWLSQQPALTRRRGLRGLALDMPARKALLLDLLGLADVVVAPSRALAEVFRANGFDRELRIIEYAHQLDWLKDLPPRAVHDRLVVGFVGRISAAKGVHILTQAVRQLRAELPMQFEVWGNPRQEPAYAESLPLPGPEHPPLRFRGAFERAQIAGVYGQMDVLVVPSVWRENNPLVIQEAFAAGVPVIASRLGGMAEFVQPEVNGLLFEAGNPTALAAALTRLAAEPHLLPRLRRGLPPVRTLDQELGEIQALYAELVAGSAQPAIP